MTDQTLSSLLATGREVWGDQRLTIQEIAVRATVTVGDLARLARTADETGEFDRAEAAKELGNLLVSSIRWLSDLGIPLHEAVGRAVEAQRAYAQRLESRDRQE